MERQTSDRDRESKSSLGTFNRSEWTGLLVLTRCISSWSWVMRSICDKSRSIALLNRDARILFVGRKSRRRKLHASECTHENNELIAEM